MKRIFITSAAGQTGIAVIANLAQQKDIEILAGIRPSKKEEHEKRLSEFNVKCVAVDTHDTKALVKSFQNVDDLLIIPSTEADKVAQGMNCIAAAKEANVKFVLLLSMVKAEEKQYLFAYQFRELEEALAKSGIQNYCIIRSGFYAQNLLLYKKQLKEGTLPLPFKTGKFAPIDVEGIGECCAKILLNCKEHFGKTYEITGSESVDGTTLASLLSKGLGRDIRYKDIELKEAKKLLLDQNVPAHEIQEFLEFYEVVQDGGMDFVSPDCKNICGHSCASIVDFAKAHSAEVVGK